MFTFVVCQNNTELLLFSCLIRHIYFLALQHDEMMLKAFALRKFPSKCPHTQKLFALKILRGPTVQCHLVGWSILTICGSLDYDYVPWHCWTQNSISDMRTLYFYIYDSQPLQIIMAIDGYLQNYNDRLRRIFPSYMCRKYKKYENKVHLKSGTKEINAFFENNFCSFRKGRGVSGQIQPVRQQVLPCLRKLRR